MNKIEICSSALLLLGADEITTFEDETREAKICNAIYELTVKTCLADRNWSFSQNQFELNKLSQTPLFGFKYAFQLPNDYIRLCGKENPSLPHQIKEDYLYCDVEKVRVNYIFRASEEKFPPHFTEYLICKLCEKLAVSIMEDPEKARYYADRVIATRRTAGLVDSQSNGDTRVPITTFSLIACRI
jgi:hypothetical protein